jgi:predicted DNA-binding protein (MmcQ/YjbR family)
MNSLNRIRKHCLAKPGAVEDEPWPGDTAWKVKGKIFAMGGKTAVTVKSTPEKQSALILHPNVEKAAYVGRFGWVTVKIDSKEDLEFALDLVDESYYSIVTPRKTTKKKPL